MEKSETKDITICKRCKYWKDPSPATGYKYGFCTKPHSTTEWNFYCRDGEPDATNKGGTEERW